MSLVFSTLWADSRVRRHASAKPTPVVFDVGVVLTGDFLIKCFHSTAPDGDTSRIKDGSEGTLMFRTALHTAFLEPAMFLGRGDLDGPHGDAARFGDDFGITLECDLDTTKEATYAIPPLRPHYEALVRTHREILAAKATAKMQATLFDDATPPKPADLIARLGEGGSAAAHRQPETERIVCNGKAANEDMGGSANVGDSDSRDASDGSNSNTSHRGGNGSSSSSSSSSTNVIFGPSDSFRPPGFGHSTSEGTATAVQARSPRAGVESRAQQREAIGDDQQQQQQHVPPSGRVGGSGRSATQDLAHLRQRRAVGSARVSRRKRKKSSSRRDVFLSGGYSPVMHPTLDQRRTAYATGGAHVSSPFATDDDNAEFEPFNFDRASAPVSYSGGSSPLMAGSYDGSSYMARSLMRQSLGVAVDNPAQGTVPNLDHGDSPLERALTSPVSLDLPKRDRRRGVSVAKRKTTDDDPTRFQSFAVVGNLEAVPKPSSLPARTDSFLATVVDLAGPGQPADPADKDAVGTGGGGSSDAAAS